MNQPEFDDIEAAIQKLADEFDAKLADYVKLTGIPEEEAKTALRALEGLKATKERIHDLCGSANPYESLGQSFLAGSDESLTGAIEAVRQADFLSALGAAVRVIRELDLAFAFLAMEERQGKASRAANARHLADQMRKAEAKELFFSRGWRFKADAARAIEQAFHVGYKTAERWIIEWTKQNSPSAQEEGNSP